MKKKKLQSAQRMSMMRTGNELQPDAHRKWKE